METKFTISPWVIKSGQIEGSEFTIMDNRISDDKRSCICDIYQTFNQEGEANANLIANCPDLFHALNRLIIAAKPHTTTSSNSQLRMRINEAESIINKILNYEQA